MNLPVTKLTTAATTREGFDQAKDTGHAPASSPAHDDIATSLLRGMFDDNLRLAARMMDIGDCGSAKRLLQSAISQCDQIASYQPKPGAHGVARPTNQTIEV